MTIEALQQIRAIAEAALSGQAAAGSSGTADLAPITTKPDAFADVGVDRGNPKQIVVSPGQVVAVDFVVADGDRPSAVKWFPAGANGAHFRRTSWSIFDSGGSRVAGADNYGISGTLGWAVDDAILSKLGHGSYRLGVSVDAGGNLAFQQA
jgi:hypothetical protein